MPKHGLPCQLSRRIHNADKHHIHFWQDFATAQGGRTVTFAVRWSGDSLATRAALGRSRKTQSVSSTLQNAKKMAAHLMVDPGNESPGFLRGHPWLAGPSDYGSPPMNRTAGFWRRGRSRRNLALGSSPEPLRRKQQFTAESILCWRAICTRLSADSDATQVCY